MTLTVLIAIGATAAVLLLKGMIAHKPAARAANTRPGRITKKTAKNAVPARLPYHAVSCRSGVGSCEAVEEINGERFLVEVAPQLPLDACAKERCKCKYLHHQDRRDNDDDRRALYGIKSEFYEYTSKQDRRVKRGRRASDGEVEQAYGQI
jgi:hypothetical protein